MGTRADFYVGRGEGAEWLGSIAWDGYPDGIPMPVRNAPTEADYRKALTDFFDDDRDDVTLPEQGWPWPWDTSATTDYAYAFDANNVWATNGGRWWDACDDEPDEDESSDGVEFPNMAARKNVRWDKGSGLLILRG